MRGEREAYFSEQVHSTAVGGPYTVRSYRWRHTESQLSSLHYFSKEPNKRPLRLTIFRFFNRTNRIKTSAY